MSVPNFHFTGALFTYETKPPQLRMRLDVSFMPMGGTEFGVIVALDGEEIARIKHTGTFTSKEAAEYAMLAYSAKMRAENNQADNSGIVVKLKGDTGNQPGGNLRKL